MDAVINYLQKYINSCLGIRPGMDMVLPDGPISGEFLPSDHFIGSGETGAVASRHGKAEGVRPHVSTSRDLATALRYPMHMASGGEVVVDDPEQPTFRVVATVICKNSASKHRKSHKTHQQMVWRE